MEEQIKTLAQITHQNLTKDVRNAVFFTLIIDGTTDNSKTDQVTF